VWHTERITVSCSGRGSSGCRPGLSKSFQPDAKAARHTPLPVSPNWAPGPHSIDDFFTFPLPSASSGASSRARRLDGKRGRGTRLAMSLVGARESVAGNAWNVEEI